MQTSNELKELNQIIEELTAELLLEKKLSQVYKEQAQGFKHRLEISQHRATRLEERILELERKTLV